MTEQIDVRKRRLIRFAIPAVVCLVALAAVAAGTKVWQGVGTSQTQAMELRGFWLGMRFSAVDSKSAEELGIPPTVRGAVIADVQTSSRATLAGLAPGDVVTRVDGKDVASLLDLYSLSSKLDVGRQIQVDILRAGRPMAVLLSPPEPAGPPNAAQWYGAGRPVAAPALGAANDWNGGGRMRTTVTQ